MFIVARLIFYLFLYFTVNDITIIMRRRGGGAALRLRLWLTL
jgi:hypothetical protein